MQEQSSPKKLAFTVGEAASLVSLSRSFTYEMINAGKLKTIKIGRTRRITPSQLQEFLDRPEFED